MGNVKSMRRNRSTWLLVLLIGTAAVSCSKEKERNYISASEVCDGAFQGASARAVESVTGSNSFFAGDSDAKDRVADALKEGFLSGRSWSRTSKFCELSPEETKGIHNAADIDFSIYAPSDIGGGGVAAGERIYAIGKEAKSGIRGARIYFECATPQLKGSSSNPARIMGSLKLERDLEENSNQHRETNLTIIHAASLAMAKKLDCENNGGLPGSPSFKEIQPAEEPPPETE